MPQIALVSHQHDDNVRVGMVAKLFQPTGDVLIGLVLGDIVNEEGADCAAVVGAGDGAIALLARGIPNLSLDRLVVDLDAASGELDADRGLAVEVELVTGETREQVGFTNAGVSNQDHLEEELGTAVSAASQVCCNTAAVNSASEREGMRAYIVFVVGHGRSVVLGRGFVAERWRGYATADRLAVRRAGAVSWSSGCGSVDKF